MIIVNFYRDDETELLDKFTVNGHAGYAKNGSDIVCASVSALVIATINAIQSRYMAHIADSEGFIACSIDKPDLGSELICKPLLYGIKEIENQYGDYVKTHLHYV